MFVYSQVPGPVGCTKDGEKPPPYLVLLNDHQLSYLTLPFTMITNLPNLTCNYLTLPFLAQRSRTYLHNSDGAISDRGPVDGSYEDATGYKWT